MKRNYEIFQKEIRTYSIFKKWWRERNCETKSTQKQFDKKMPKTGQNSPRAYFKSDWWKIHHCLFVNVKKQKKLKSSPLEYCEANKIVLWICLTEKKVQNSVFHVQKITDTEQNTDRFHQSLGKLYLKSKMLPSWKIYQ